MSRATGFVYVWEYVVRPEKTREFEAAYGPDGIWAAFFQAAPGYRGTELLRDEKKPNRYLTIDHWDSHAAWQSFCDSRASEFKEVDDACATLTLEEREIGLYDELSVTRPLAG